MNAWIARHRTLSAVAGVILLIGIIGATDDDAPSSTSGADRPATSGSSARDRSPHHTKTHGSRHQEPRTDRDRQPDNRPPRPPPPHTFLVTHVVDGDTVDLGNGKTVRLVGIDTPEIGECGYQRAKDALTGLVEGKRVRLAVSDEDTDRYGRLLRYVDIGTIDAGLRLIKSGLAVARYDSRDGYGYHPREPLYIAADAQSKDFSCSGPKTFVQAPVSGKGGCAPGYRPCVPAYPPDVDCSDVNGPIHVTGSDPHGLDADGDGTACE